MASIKIDKFFGIIPKIHPTLLQKECATIAHNCILKDGKLSPMKESCNVSDIKVRCCNNLDDIKNAKTLYIWQKNNGSKELIAWPTDDIYISKGNLKKDPLSRIFITGHTGVGINGTDPVVLIEKNDSHKNTSTSIFTSLVKNPIHKPVVILNPIGNVNSNNTRYTYFVQTWVDEYGYESAPSEVGSLYKEKYIKTKTQSSGDVVIRWINCSNPNVELESEPDISNLEITSVSSRTIDGLTITNTTYSEETGYNDGDEITIKSTSLSFVNSNKITRRIYKVNSGDSGNRMQFVCECAIEDDYLLALKDENLGEELTFIESTDDNIRGICAMPNGYYSAFDISSRKEVIFSEISMPYSWPMQYRYEINYNIIGMCCIGSSLVVLTDGYPYLFSGTTPESMTSYILKGPASCISKNSICQMNGRLYFASTEGICSIYSNYTDGNVTSNITENIFTREQWRELNPSSCIMCAKDNSLYAFFTKVDGEKVNYIINLSDGLAAVITHDDSATCVCVDETNNDMYYVKGY